MESNLKILLNFFEKNSKKLNEILSIEYSTVEERQEILNKIKIHQDRTNKNVNKILKNFLSRDRKEKLDKLKKL